MEEGGGGDGGVVVVWAMSWITVWGVFREVVRRRRKKKGIVAV